MRTYFVLSRSDGENHALFFFVDLVETELDQLLLADFKLVAKEEKATDAEGKLWYQEIAVDEGADLPDGWTGGTLEYVDLLQ